METVGSASNPQMWIAIITAGATVIAALVGSWAGAQLALRRFRTERGFDRRLDWYERVVSAIQDLRSVITTARQQPDATTAGELSQRWATIPSSMHRLIRVASESVIYADVRSIEKLHAALLEWARHAQSLKQQGDETSEADRVLLANELDRLLGQAFIAVGGEARLHLGLEVLPDKARNAFEANVGNSERTNP